MLQSPLTIICPHCSKSIALDDALTQQIEEKYKKEYAARQTEDRIKIEQTERIRAEKILKDQFELQIRTQKEELIEAKKRSQELLTQLMETNRLIRELKRKDEERDLEMVKKLTASEDKIRQESLKKAEEDQHLKLLEKEKQLQNALKEADELKRKLQQGSQQNQGEVLELELEKILRLEFSNDKILPVAKGVRGADLIQEVWDRNGIRCGVILWESKNAKWNENWIDKLKDDQREMKAELAVIISEILPPDIKGAAFRKNVWVAHRNFAVGIGMALRANLIQANYIKTTLHGKNDKKETLWNYLTGTEFQQRMEIILEAFTEMKLELEKEKQAYVKIWAKREKQIQRVLHSTAGLRGDLEGVMGNALPEIKQLTLDNGSGDLDKTDFIG